MLNILLTWILPFVFVLGAAVVLHEFGHFIVAKTLRVRVETFSVGFGPRLFGKVWGTTDYRVSLIPLGGYVKLGGDDTNAPIEGATAQNIPARERFDLRPRWQKFLVMVAGPVMNILTALAVVFLGAVLSGVPVMPTSPVVGKIEPSSASEAAGLRVGDRIVSFNGKDNPTWERVSDDMRISPDQPLAATVERNGARVQLTIKPTREIEEGDTVGVVDFFPDYGDLPLTVTEVSPGSAAAEAGLQAGDHLYEINGERMRDQQDVRIAVNRLKGQPLYITIERGGVRSVATAKPKIQPDGSALLGVRSWIEIPTQRIGVVSAVGYAVNRNVEILRLTGEAFLQIFRGQRSARASLSGPIGIARASASAAQRFGWAGIISMLGFLSLNLGVVNLLPIPVLDGGAIFLLVVEAVLGWIGVRLSMTVRERIQQVGFVVLLLLMGFVITNDLLKEASNFRHSDDKPAATQGAK
ncbi:MAG: RIP metalloprotease RseP [Acidobacteria bacterium]|nr:RIP metalloprotease RseP [Acidobacteriota bacterium]